MSLGKTEIRQFYPIQSSTSIASPVMCGSIGRMTVDGGTTRAKRCFNMDHKLVREFAVAEGEGET